VWLVTAYFPEGMHKRIGGRLISVLKWIHKDLTDPLFEPEEKRIKELENFLGNRLEDFSQYMEKLGVIGKRPMADREYLYTPDLVAKKNQELYIIEVKVNTGKFDSEKEKRGFMLARDYGFIPMLITLKVNIEVSDLVVAEL